MEKRPVLLTTRLAYLVYLNYRVDPALLENHVPSGTSLDLRDGEAILCVVGLLCLDLKLRGVRVPFHQNFEELHLRFLVKRNSLDGIKRGFAFLQRTCAKPLVALVGGALLGARYTVTRMDHSIEREGEAFPKGACVKYRFRSLHRWNRVSVEPRGRADYPVAESEEQFIVERYWGYNALNDGGTIEYLVEHEPWKIWAVENAELRCDITRNFGSAFLSVLERSPDSAFLADGSTTVMRKPRRLDQYLFEPTLQTAPLGA